MVSDHRLCVTPSLPGALVSVFGGKSTGRPCDGGPGVVPNESWAGIPVRSERSPVTGKLLSFPLELLRLRGEPPALFLSADCEFPLNDAAAEVGREPAAGTRSGFLEATLPNASSPLSVGAPRTWEMTHIANEMYNREDRSIV